MQLIMTSYFRPKAFRRSVESIVSHTTGYHLHIIDNSHGGLETELARLRHPQITVYRRPQNQGKGAAVMAHYAKIIGAEEEFVSIDPDIEVRPGWLDTLRAERKRLSRFGLLAPILLRHATDTYESQMAGGSLHMHVANQRTIQLKSTIYYNGRCAGPVFLIDRAFFESAGGFPTNQLYGNDDGVLCAAARKAGLFVGFTTAVQLVHLDQDVDAGYTDWKHRNVRGNVDHTGYWD